MLDIQIALHPSICHTAIVHLPQRLRIVQEHDLEERMYCHESIWHQVQPVHVARATKFKIKEKFSCRFRLACNSSLPPI